MTIQSYLAQLADAMPRMMPERNQIIADVSAHIEEAMQRGEALDSVLAKLSDPTKLALSYLSEVPLDIAAPRRRVGAIAIDVAILIVITAVIATPFAALFMTMDQESQEKYGVIFAILLAMGLLAVFAGYIGYFLVGESRYGQTLGKHWLKLLVVRESGARISAGQALVRLLPAIFHFWWIDAIFALFTERQQRAFELLSKTRVIAIDPANSLNMENRSPISNL